MKKVVFINYYNKGDIHASRGFVRQIIKKVKSIDGSISFSYAHKHSCDLLIDVDGLGFEPDALWDVRNECSKLHQDPQYKGICKINDSVYISTWYAQQNYKYMNKYGITIDALYEAMDDSCKELWNFSLSDISDDPSTFFPIIDYSKFKIDDANEWLKSHSSKKIFVANGPALSGQAINFNLSNVIEKIANIYTDHIFLLTDHQEKKINLSNVYYTKDIINKNSNCDINENAYLSSHCDIIIGRGSGPSSFAMNYENLFLKNKKFIYFCNFYPLNSNKFWVGDLLRDKIEYKSNFIFSDDGSEDNAYKIIKSAL